MFSCAGIFIMMLIRLHEVAGNDRNFYLPMEAVFLRMSCGDGTSTNELLLKYFAVVLQGFPLL